MNYQDALSFSRRRYGVRHPSHEGFGLSRKGETCYVMQSAEEVEQCEPRWLRSPKWHLYSAPHLAAKEWQSSVSLTKTKWRRPMTAIPLPGPFSVPITASLRGQLRREIEEVAYDLNNFFGIGYEATELMVCGVASDPPEKTIEEFIGLLERLKAIRSRLGGVLRMKGTIDVHD
jgi:hypothetical protein